MIGRTPGCGPPSSTRGLSFDCGWKLLRKLDNCLHLCMSEIIPFGSYVSKRRPQSAESLRELVHVVSAVLVFGDPCHL